MFNSKFVKTTEALLLPFSAFVFVASETYRKATTVARAISDCNRVAALGSSF